MTGSPCAQGLRLRAIISSVTVGIPDAREGIIFRRSRHRLRRTEWHCFAVGVSRVIGADGNGNFARKRPLLAGEVQLPISGHWTGSCANWQAICL
jgi:hypothetical protein